MQTKFTYQLRNTKTANAFFNRLSAKILVLTVVLTTLLLNDTFATNFYTSGSGNWTSKPTWVGNNDPGYTISAGDSVFINQGHQITFNGTINVHGVLVINDAALVSDNGKRTIEVHSGGTLIVIGGASIENLNNAGTVDIEGGDVEISGNTVNTGTMSLDSNATITTDGSFDNSGTLNNSGTVEVGDELTNSGTINNDGYIETDDLTITSTGTLNNNDNLTVNNDLNNNGDLNNTDYIYVGNNLTNTSTQTLTNDGTIDVGGDVDNSGSMNNNGDMNVSGNVDNSGTVTNNGNLLVDGTIDSTSGTVDGDGYICNSDLVTDPSNGDNTGIDSGQDICGDSGPLPVSMLSFDVANNGDIIWVSWVTATETNNSHFTIEIAVNSFDFKPVKQIKGNGNSNRPLSYSSSLSLNETGIVYVRLRQTDYDGKNKSLGIKKINLANIADEVKVYPNPVNSGEAVYVLSPENSDIRIMDMQGRMIYNTISAGHTVVETSGFSAGMYIMQVITNGETITRRIVVR